MSKVLIIVTILVALLGLSAFLVLGNSNKGGKCGDGTCPYGQKCGKEGDCVFDGSP